MLRSSQSPGAGSPPGRTPAPALAAGRVARRRPRPAAAYRARRTADAGGPRRASSAHAVLLSTQPVVLVPGSIDYTGKTDVTGALQNFLDHLPDNRLVRFHRNGRYRVEGTLYVTNHNGLTFDGQNATYLRDDPRHARAVPVVHLRRGRDHLPPRDRARRQSQRRPRQQGLRPEVREAARVPDRGRAGHRARPRHRDRRVRRLRVRRPGDLAAGDRTSGSTTRRSGATAARASRSSAPRM